MTENYFVITSNSRNPMSEETDVTGPFVYREIAEQAMARSLGRGDSSALVSESQLRIAASQEGASDHLKAIWKTVSELSANCRQKEG